ncbi:YceI family protein [Niastella populi]|uniref:Polyisoprenoid-binding protein n=1 Tax=Niastella populi TaxID=550983 RepID=A0A1V9FKX6_9BACT|nr:YceI family protein [Niastella populi]OQP59029.1 polyisoprenoid-binding protein [Niastella populi]
MKQMLIVIALFVLSLPVLSQKRYFTKSGQINFAAGTAVEDIDGINKAATSVFDATSGQIEFAVLVKGFEFKRALMQEHFNENYMESDRFPKSVFKGKIVNVDKVNFQKDGSYPVTVKGVLEMHGVKKEVETTGSLKVTGETVHSDAAFTVLLADYKIAIPSLVKDKISPTVTIKVNCNYNVLK